MPPPTARKQKISLLEARSGNEILAAVDQAIAPEGQHAPPDVSELAHWLADGTCPHEAAQRADQRLSAVMEGAGWIWTAVGVPDNDEGRSRYMLAAMHGKNNIEGVRAVHSAWRGIPQGRRPKHPLGPLLRAWQKRPVTLFTEPNIRPDPVLPARLAMVSANDPRAGKTFSYAAHADESTGPKPLVLPGFSDDGELVGPALPLVLYDLGVGEKERGGIVPAPLALRLFIEAVLSAPLAHRDSPVAMYTSLRKLLTWLYPSKRRPRPAEYWGPLNDAVEALESPEARIPFYDPETKRGANRRIVSATDIPRGPQALDDYVTLTVHLPPGSGSGPIMDRERLRHWGVRRGPAYRAMIGLAYRWYHPGRTRIPIKTSNKIRWYQATDPQQYDPIMPDELAQICYPTSSRAQRRDLRRDAQRVIAAMIADGDVRQVGDRLLPPLKPYAQRLLEQNPETDG